MAKLAESATIIADSISSRGHRVVTFVIVLWRAMLAELNTHRMFSRNSASSRAIPTRTQLQALVRRIFIPDAFGTAIPKMNAGPVLTGKKLDEAIKVWGDSARSQLWYALILATSPTYVDREWAYWQETVNTNFNEFVVEIATRLDNKEHPIHQDPDLLNVSKGLTNRLIEVFSYQTVIITVTEVENFFNLRTDSNAQEEIRKVAVMMKEAYDNSTPTLLEEGEWHLPFIQPSEKEWAKANPELAVKSSAARSARVSYMTHDKSVIDYEADYRLADGLGANGHMSPFEHPCTPMSDVEWQWRMNNVEAMKADPLSELIEPEALAQQINAAEFSANFRGWVQARRGMKNEAVFQPPKPEQDESASSSSIEVLPGQATV